MRHSSLTSEWPSVHHQVSIDTRVRHKSSDSLVVSGRRSGNWLSPPANPAASHLFSTFSPPARLSVTASPTKQRLKNNVVDQTDGVATVCASDYSLEWSSQNSLSDTDKERIHSYALVSVYIYCT